MASRESRFSSLKTKIRAQVVEINDTRIKALHRVIGKLIPGVTPELNCLTYKSFYSPLTRSEHLASLIPIVPELCDELSPIQTCIQIGGSVKVTSELPVTGSLVRESFCEVDTERLHRRSKLIPLSLHNRYLAGGKEYLSESILLHYRLKPQLCGSTWIDTVHAPDLFDAMLCIDESALLSFVSLQAYADRTSIDYEYVTQTLGCPGLLVPMDLIGLFLLVLLGQKKPRREIKSLEYHIYGQIFTGQSVRLCATVLDSKKILLWAKSANYLIYRGIVHLV